MMYITYPTASDVEVISAAIKSVCDVPFKVKIHKTCGASVNPRLCKDYAKNVWTQQQRNAMHAALNAAGFCSPGGYPLNTDCRGDNNVLTIYKIVAK